MAMAVNLTMGVNFSAGKVPSLGSREIDPVLQNLDDWGNKVVYGEQRKEALDEIYRFLNDEQATEVNLSRKGLSTLPIGFLTLSAFKTRLQKFDLSENELKEISPEIGTLVHLTDLNLSKNHLERLPEEIGNLERLCNLNLSYNWKICSQGIPKGIFSLSEQCEIHLIACDLSNGVMKQISQKMKDLLYNGPVMFYLERAKL